MIYWEARVENLRTRIDRAYFDMAPGWPLLMRMKRLLFPVDRNDALIK